ncbi:MAG TPA: glycerophosphodiester phosphodiesterase family protein [bacterium]|nr:glycerophosphodiester phosphodiesterase family protein [bacterium]
MRKLFALMFVAAAMFMVSKDARGMEMANGRKVMVIAHRGASGYAPENTMVSFKRALEMKAEMVELDVWRSKDGVLVVMHDGKPDRTTDGTGNLEEMTLEQIKKLDAGAKFKPEFSGERVPTLEEAISWAAASEIGVDIEIKGAGCEEGIVEMLKKYDMTYKVIVTSFHHDYIAKIKKLDPAIKTGALVGAIGDLKAIIENCHPDAVVPNYMNVTKSVVDDAHKLNIPVIVYTVNDALSFKMMYKAGVDGIISNYPDQLIAFLEKNNKKKPAAE